MCKFLDLEYSCGHDSSHALSICQDHRYKERDYISCRGFDRGLTLYLKTKCGPCLQRKFFELWSAIHMYNKKTYESVVAEGKAIAEQKNDPAYTNGTTTFQVLGFNGPSLSYECAWEVRDDEGAFWSKTNDSTHYSYPCFFKPGTPSPLQNEVRPEDVVIEESDDENEVWGSGWEEDEAEEVIETDWAWAVDEMESLKLADETQEDEFNETQEEGSNESQAEESDMA